MNLYSLPSISEPQGMCYIETSNLDGETNLKIRQVIVFYLLFRQLTPSWVCCTNGQGTLTAALTQPPGSPADRRHEGHRQPGASLWADGVRESKPPPVRVRWEHPPG